MSAMRHWLRRGAIGAAVPLAVLGCGGPDVTAPATEVPQVTAAVSASLSQTGRIAFVSHRAGNDEIYVMNADGTGLIRLTNNAAADDAPAWSPDGAKIAFVSHRAGNDEIYVINANGTGGLIRLTNNAAADGAPTWSPLGDKIAFVSHRAGNDEIYTMKPDGSGVTRLTNNAAVDNQPAWSPLGTKIAFVSHRAGNDEIYTMKPDGSGVTRLTKNAAVDGQPAWSPDGSKIAFVSHRSGNDEIYVMDPNDLLALPDRLTNNAAVDGAPDWATGGGTIAFQSNRDGDFEIYEMNSGGTEVTQLTHNSVFDGDPAITIITPTVGSVSVTPKVAGVDVTTSRQFTATVTEDPYAAGVTWSLSGTGCSGTACGTVAPSKSASGAPVKYTAPATVPNPADLTLTATSVTDPGFFASASIVVTRPGVLAVAVFPTSVVIRSGGGKAQLTAYVFHDPSNAGVSWSVGLGSISPTKSASGVPVTYTAPASFVNGQTFAEARSVTKPTTSDTAIVFLHKNTSCPLVYSWDGRHWRLDSGTFGGAIVRALTRTDVDNLDFAAPQNGVLRLKLANELNETDYIDGITVLAVDHDSGVTVAPDGAGRLYSLGRMTPPKRARDFRGGDVLSLVNAPDGRNWESSSAARDTARTADIRDGIELSFSKPARARTARLVVDANNSPWAAELMKAFVAAHGRATQAWYDSLNAAPKLARQMFAKLAREAFLSVSVRIDGQWQRQGAVWEAGPEIVKRQVVPLDLSRVRGRTVEIRLESVPNFWLVDHVALDVSGPRPLRVASLSSTTALNERGQDVRDLLAPVDGRFLTMEPGEFAEVHYRVPKLQAGRTRTFVLQSTGYYRIHSPEVSDPDLALLHRVLTEPDAISRIAVARMNRLVLALHGVKQ